jgi:beta-N-acetylhexosaminidase
MRHLFFIFISSLTVSTSVFASSQSIDEAVGQMMMIGFKGTSINENSDIVKEIKNYHIGGVILVNHTDPITRAVTTNIENPEQLKKLTRQLQFFAKKYHDYPLLIAVNQEGGLINTLKPSQGFNNKNDPSEFDLGKNQDEKFTFEKTQQRSVLLKKMGINFNLAPVADLNINPENPGIGKLQRSFGEQVESVSRHLNAAIKAYRQNHIICALKHFPGLGSAEKNTDYAKADVTASWTQKELIPYSTLIEKNTSCDFVMVTHLINKKLDDTGVPVSLSKKVVTDLLVNQMHFKGLIITDDMDAAAIRKHYSTDQAIEKAVLAGNNVIIYGGTQGYDADEDARLLFDTLKKLAETNGEAKKQIEKSAGKIARFKATIVIPAKEARE